MGELVYAVLLIAAGVVIKILVPMPWLDDPVRRGYGAVRDWLASKL